MPVCHRCNEMQATVEMRRSTTPGLWVCKATEACKQRRAALRARVIAERKGK